MMSNPSTWLQCFPNMSTGMRLQMISKPPPSLDKPTMFRAMLDLPFNERTTLIQRIPKHTLRSLILSLPRETQQSVYKALTTAVTSKPKKNKNTNNNNNNNNKHQQQKPMMNKQCNNNNDNIKKRNKNKNKERDKSLQAALNKDPSNNGYSTLNKHSSSRIGIGRKSKASYSTSTKLKKSLEKLSNINGNINGEDKNNETGNAIKEELDNVAAISDYGDFEHDRVIDPCSKHINFNQFDREYFLMNALRMMRAFGDAPQPSRYSALIILNHIKSYLKCVINKMESQHKHNKNNRKQGRKSAIKHLDILETWYPLQVKIFKKWKFFKSQAGKNDDKKEYQVPDLINDDGDRDNKSDDDNGNNDESSPNLLNALPKEAIADEYKIFVNFFSIDIGWGSRLIECDTFTKSMNRREYFKFSKCREASLTSYKKKFHGWLKCKEYPKILTNFLGFIAWDRIGCIVQIARKIKGMKYGLIIKQIDEFLMPTEIVNAILFINNLSEVTPKELNFIDHSFDKIDTSNVTLIGIDNDNKNNNDNKNDNDNKNNNDKSNNKRKHTEIENNENMTNPPNKKQRTQ